MKIVKLKVVETYSDNELGKLLKPKEIIYVSIERAKVLLKKQLVKILLVTDEQVYTKKKK